MNKKFYITTTLPYVNGAPHIGHTLEFIQADVIARYQRLVKGNENVWFNVGTDEHGLKMLQKAQSEGKTPEEYTTGWANKWKEFCELFLISYDTFYRTSEDYHIPLAQEFWKNSEEAGDIYKKKYEGLYCVGCEAFITEKDLVDGKCPDHKTEPIEYSEENYFFKLSKYRQELLDWLDSNKDVVQPNSKYEELRNWISNMEDISISRNKKNLPWGIDVPGDQDQVMYVWFDALTNYTNVFGLSNEDLKKISRKDAESKTDANEADWWPGVQIFGPDNLRFQGAIWQGMLASNKKPHTSKLLCHGMVLASDGTKMSKTIGNVVSPFEQEEKYGAEVIRFYIVSGIRTFGDSPYKEDDLINLYNSHLANNFGNLLNRVIHLSNKLEVEINNSSAVENGFKTKVDEFVNTINQNYSEFELQTAAENLNELANFGNEYITKEEPWSKAKSKKESQKILNNLSYLLAQLIDLYQPIIPASSERARKLLENREAGILFEKIER